MLVFSLAGRWRDSRVAVQRKNLTESVAKNYTFVHYFCRFSAAPDFRGILGSGVVALAAWAKDFSDDPSQSPRRGSSRPPFRASVRVKPIAPGESAAQTASGDRANRQAGKRNSR
jgi:hypothetical protein